MAFRRMLLRASKRLHPSFRGLARGRAFWAIGVALFFLAGCRGEHGVAPSPTASPRASAPPAVVATPVPLPSPTPTPDPALVRAEARQAMEDGDYPKAIPLWEWLVPRAERAERAADRLALARAYIEEGRRPEAATQLVAAFEEAETSAQKQEILGLLGNLYEALGEWRAAVEVYQRYLDEGGGAADYVRFHMAKAYKALGEETRLQETLLAIDRASLPAAKRAEVLEELAASRRRAGETEGALQAYEEILSFAQQDAYRALILKEEADALQEAGREAEAEKIYQRIVTEYPDQQATALALNALEAMGALRMDDLERGRAYLEAGEASRAVEILQGYLKQRRVPNKVEAYYHLGRAYSTLRDFPHALEAFDQALAAFEALKRADQEKMAPLKGDILLAQARAVALQGGDAAHLYYAFWQKYPKHPRAADALYEAASWAESEIGWETAAEYYRAFRKHYPTDRRARQALFREGLALYAQGRPAEAVPLWTEWLAAADLSAADTAKGLTWLGLAAQAMGDASTAQSLWQKAEEAAPTLYYGLRAHDLRLGLPPILAEKEDVSVPPMTFDEGSWQEIETWVKAWYTPTLTITDTVRLDALTARAEALGRLGWYEDRKATLQQAREAAWGTPPALLRLARWNAEQGTYAYAIQAAERLLALGKSQGAAEAPEALWRIAYPTVYGHLVEQEASRYGLDPLLFLALIRQESRFDARAVSYAGATGLAQVMPQTASWIAERLGEANYRRDLLTRPMVSLRYGAWYFHTMLTMFNRDWVVSLVAYNAGPGNAQRWTKSQPVTDHDLFFETIPSQEPQNYVRLIYEQYAIYRRLYGEKTGSPSASENP